MEAVFAFFLAVVKFASCSKSESVYLGCFSRRDFGKVRENDPAEGTYMPTNLTTVNCGFYCFVEKDWQYFGTTIGSRCYCWTSAAGFQHYATMEETFCSEPCPGNQSEICGGGDGISIYGDAAGSCKVIKISNGQAKKQRSILTFTCNEGYHLKGSQTLHCNKGSNFSKTLTWQGDIPICTGSTTIFSSRAIIITIVFITLAILLAIILTMRRYRPKCQTITILRLTGFTPSCDGRDVRIQDKTAASTKSDITGTIKSPRDENLKDDANIYLSVFDPEFAYSLVKIDDPVNKNSNDDIYCRVENKLHAKVNI